uniref:Protein N-terminal glutamine amidohydrolase n=1 Tax=Octopus bimaculoides TaxID=37653 RepID=A0A0L8I3D4_OCTBM
MDDGTLALNEDAKKEVWRCHYDRLLNKENEWEEESLPYVDPIEGPAIRVDSTGVPIWHQKIGKPNEPVVWDYHVIFLWRLEGESYVYDLDSSLPFPCKLEMYINEAIKSDDILQPQYHRFFRVIDAKIYLRHFASNRKHMLDSTGAWRQEPPPYPCIRTEQTDSNFQDFLSLDPNIGYGTIFSLKSFIKKYALHENNGLS